MLQLPPFDITSDDDQVPEYQYTIDLSGVSYQIRLRWRDRPGRWYIDLRAADGTALILGQRLVPGRVVGQQNTGRAPLSGKLLLWDKDQSGGGCRYADLGGRCVLLWISDVEIEAA